MLQYPKPAPNLETWTSNFYYIEKKEKKITQTESESLHKNKFEQQCHGSNLRIHAIQPSKQFEQ